MFKVNIFEISEFYIPGVFCVSGILQGDSSKSRDVTYQVAYLFDPCQQFTCQENVNINKTVRNEKHCIFLSYNHRILLTIYITEQFLKTYSKNSLLAFLPFI